MQKRRPVMLVVLDGWGWREEAADNAIRQARIPNFDRLWRTCPHALVHASGTDVGLPRGQMGNSEVGHLNIGAGRVVVQDLPRISAAIADGEIKRSGCGRLAAPATSWAWSRREECIRTRIMRWRSRRCSPKPAYRRFCMLLPMAATRHRVRRARTSGG
jgi:hypothetical protein